MTYYHAKKPLAEAVASKMREDPRVSAVAVQLEPYNGWVVVVVPKMMDLSDLADRVEIRDGVKRQPPGRVRPTPVLEEGAPRAPRKPREPGQGGGYSSHACWTVIEQVHSPTATRDSVVEAIVASGYDKTTASRQYRHWLKNKGLWK